MCLLLPLSRIDRQLSAALKTHLDTLGSKLESEDAFDQAIFDEICYATAWCRTALNNALDDLGAEKQRLRKNVFKDPVVAAVFGDVAGDEPAFPDRVDNMDTVGAAYRAGQQALDAFERDMRRKWEEVAKMSKFKRSEFVLLARRGIVATVAEMEKMAGKRVEESKRLEGEIRKLQRSLSVRDELEDAKEEWHERRSLCRCESTGTRFCHKSFRGYLLQGCHLLRLALLMR